MYARRTENHIFVKRIQIVLAEHEIHAECRQCGVAVAQLRGVLFIVYGYRYACRTQHTDERHVTHARTDHADPFVRQAAQILF